MYISKNHPPRKGCDGIGDSALQAAFMRSLCAQMNDRANVSFDHFAEGRIVFGVVFVFRTVSLALLHRVTSLRFLIRLHKLCLFYCKKKWYG
jgi:hypothetical protein